MKAIELPSKSYRVQPSYTDKNGKVHRTSITHKSKEVALERAYAWKREMRDMKEIDHTTVAEAVELYIQSRIPVRSPATIRGYRNIQKQIKQLPFAKKYAHMLKKADAQEFINALVTRGNSPKTVRNYWGLVSSALQAQNVYLGKIAMPEKKENDIVIPTEAEIKEIVKAVKGTDLEIPVLLASSRGFRRGEVCALKWEDIDFKKNVIHVQRNIVLGTDKKWHVKTPKTRAGNRYVPMPKETMSRIKEICSLPSLSPHELSLRFTRVMKKLQMDYHFHTLRHFAASYLHSLSIPDAYIMQWLGWENDQVLKKIYRHTLSDQEKHFSEIANKANFTL